MIRNKGKPATRLVAQATGLLILVAACGSMHTAAAASAWTSVDGPVSCEVDGHSYQLFRHSSGSKSWDDARMFADMQSDGAVGGHLATITSQAENDCIQSLFQSKANRETWIGGEQIECDSGAPDCGWTWITEEGEFGLQNDGNTYGFVNWMAGEPNDRGGDESKLGIFLNGSEKWNDEGNVNNIGFLIVEYPRSTPAQNCFGEPGNNDPNDGEGCSLNNYLQIEIPYSDAIGPDDRITSNIAVPNPPASTVFLDPEVRDHCLARGLYPDPRVDMNGFPLEKRKLHVFEELGGRPAGLDPSNELVLDEYTYGLRCFAVSYNNWTVDIPTAYPDGVVFSGLQYAENLPDYDFVTECYDPNDPFFSDLQNISQFSYQPNDRFENQAGTSEVMTNFCFNPSRGSKFKFSLETINTHEHCGIDFDSRHGPLKVQACFYGLANEKAKLLDDSLHDARWTLSRSDYKKLDRELASARLCLLFGAYSCAQNKLNRFLAQVERSDFDTTTANHPGNLRMRAENLVFRAEMLKQARRNLR